MGVTWSLGLDFWLGTICLPKRAAAISKMGGKLLLGGRYDLLTAQFAHDRARESNVLPTLRLADGCSVRFGDPNCMISG